LKFVIYTCLRAVILLMAFAVLSAPTLAAESADRTMWRMVWVDYDLAFDELPHEDLAPYLEDFIRTVTIETDSLDDEPLPVRISAGCNNVGRSRGWRIAVPEQTIETIQDGKPHFETIPATFERRTSEWTSTLKACGRLHRIEGKSYTVYWPNSLEVFLLKHAKVAVLTEEGDGLDWADETGTVMARFEKLPDLYARNIYWRLDPQLHEDDPVLVKNFGPASIVFGFSYMSSSRSCGNFHARTEITDKTFKLLKPFAARPCKDLYDLLNGQAVPYTPTTASTENTLERILPKITQYAVTGTGKDRRLTMSDQNGRALLHLLISERGLHRREHINANIFDQLDDYEWIMEPTGSLSAETLRDTNPIRIIKYNKVRKKKSKAAIISAQNCTIHGLKVNGKPHRMNVYSSYSRGPYRGCEGEKVNEIREDWANARNILFDDSNLIFYDNDWTEVMRARRGPRLEVSDNYSPEFRVDSSGVVWTDKGIKIGQVNFAGDIIDANGLSIGKHDPTQ